MVHSYLGVSMSDTLPLKKTSRLLTEQEEYFALSFWSDFVLNANEALMRAVRDGTVVPVAPQTSDTIDDYLRSQVVAQADLYTAAFVERIRDGRFR
jgi:hypothetical protein